MKGPGYAPTPPRGGDAIALEAERIALRREEAMLTELLPQLIPFDGPLPGTWADYQRLAEPHRRQIADEHPEHVEGLHQAEQLVANAEQLDEAQTRRQSELAGAPVRSNEELALLDADQRLDVSSRLTRRQRLAMCGETDTLSKEDAFL